MRNVIYGILSAALLLTMASVTWADDNVRLGGPAAQATMTGETDLSLVRGRYYGHSYRSYGGYYGGYRSYGSVGYYSRSYYYPRSYGYYPRYYSSYYPNYYPTYYPTYCPTNYYQAPAQNYSYYPVAGEQIAPPVMVPGNFQVPQQRQYVPPMPPANGDGTFPYNGDPRNLVPLPSPQPANPAPGVIPVDGRLVSLPAETTGGTSPISSPTPTRPQSTPAPRVTYPAYGDEPIAPAPRKVNR